MDVYQKSLRLLNSIVKCQSSSRSGYNKINSIYLLDSSTKSRMAAPESKTIHDLNGRWALVSL
jgi:hypothetical protein